MNSNTPSFYTMDNFVFDGKKVLLRVDINSPIDKSGKITDDTRIKSHAETINELIDLGASVAVLAHQGRPGDSDFTTLEAHSKILQKYLKVPLTYIDDLFGPCARESIKRMKKGDVLLLENARFYSEENIEKIPEVQAKTFLVKYLAPLFSVFINDAFATAHRGHPSLTGFPMVMPSAGGRLLEKEVEFLGHVSSGASKPCIFVLGGGKVPDSVQLMETLLPKGMADKVLLTGLISPLFMVAQGKEVGHATLKVMEGKGIHSLIPRAEALLKSYGNKIMTPIDVATLKSGNRIETDLASVADDAPIYDIGEATVAAYCKELKKAKTIMMRGPAGFIEDSRFTKGSEMLLKCIVNTGAKTLLGGGHLRSISEKLGVAGKIGYFSTGGGAFITFLSGERMPSLEVLITSTQKFKSER